MCNLLPLSDQPTFSLSLSMDNEELKFPLDADSYKIIQQIGRGKNSIVYRALCIPLHINVVIKTINLDQSSANLNHGIRMASSKFNSVLNHPNILNSYCIFAVDREAWIVMPLILAGSLQSIISYSFPTGLSENCIAVILKQTLNLLYYLHSNQIVHNDVKAGNILLHQNGEIKFADFGLSSCLSVLNYHFLKPRIPNISGNPYWLAPEVIHSIDDGYTVKTDVWSFGILALELAHGRPPLSDIDGHLSQSLTKKINERFLIGDYENYMNSYCSDKRFSESFKDLVDQCLEQDPGNRPTLDGLMKHGFFENLKLDKDLLVKDMLNNLPSLEDRFKRSIERFRSTNDEGEEGEEDEDVKLRIGGWELDFEKLKLCPILYEVSVNSRETRHVQFGGEIIIEAKEEEVITEEEESKNELWDEFIREQFAAVSLELNDLSDQIDELCEQKCNKEETLAILYIAKMNMEEELSRVNSLILAHGGVLLQNDNEVNCDMDRNNNSLMIAHGGDNVTGRVIEELVEK